MLRCHHAIIDTRNIKYHSELKIVDLILTNYCYTPKARIPSILPEDPAIKKMGFPHFLSTHQSIYRLLNVLPLFWRAIILIWGRGFARTLT